MKIRQDEALANVTQARLAAVAALQAAKRTLGMYETAVLLADRARLDVTPNPSEDLELARKQAQIGQDRVRDALDTVRRPGDLGDAAYSG